MIKHVNKHLHSDPTRLRGGSLDDYIQRQIRKPYPVRAAPFTRRPAGVLNPVNLNTFVPLSSYLDNPAAIPTSALQTTKKRRRSPSTHIAKRKLTAPVPSLLDLQLNSPKTVQKDSVSDVCAMLVSPTVCTPTQSPPSAVVGPTPKSTVAKVHPLAHHRRSKNVPKASNYKCHKCGLTCADVQHMEDHFFQVHDLKDLVLICKLCGAHFCNGGALQSHAASRHPGKTTQTDEFPSQYIEARVLSYRVIPFCKVCKYSHFNLFSGSLGCWCPDKRPIAGKPKEFITLPTCLPPSAPPTLQAPITNIPSTHVCRTTGKPFRPEVVIPKHPNRIAASLANLKSRIPNSDVLNTAIAASSAASTSAPVAPSSLPISIPSYASLAGPSSSTVPSAQSLIFAAVRKQCVASDGESEDPLSDL